MLFCCPLVYFKINILKKNPLGNNISVSNILDPDLRPDILSGLIWVQTVCKGYEQTTLVGKELKVKKHRSRSAKKFSLKSQILSQIPSVLTFVLGAQKNRLIDVCFG